MTDLLHILHLEDSPADAELVEHNLRKAGLKFTLLRVETRVQFVDGLEKFQPDIILADYKLPEFDGIAALTLTREKHPLLSFIFVTGVMNEDVAIDSLKIGADDYIFKDRISRLPSAILQALEKKELLRKRLQSEQSLQASEKKFHTLFESSADAMLLVDSDSFIDCNDAALKILNCATRDNLIGKHFADIFINSSDARLTDQVFKNSSQHFEGMSRRLDGTQFYSDILLTQIELDNKTILYATIRDISVHKIQQAKLQRLTNFYSALVQCNQAIMRCTDTKELFAKICNYAVQYGGMKMAWIGMVDKATRQLRPVATYGEGIDYLQGIQISTDPNDPNSQGPSGISFLENRLVCSQDFQHDAITKPWHQRGKQFGWGSSASLPLLRAGVPVGVLTLYGNTPYF